MWKSLLIIWLSFAEYPRASGLQEGSIKRLLFFRMILRDPLVAKARGESPWVTLHPMIDEDLPFVSSVQMAAMAKSREIIGK